MHFKNAIIGKVFQLDSLIFHIKLLSGILLLILNNDSNDNNNNYNNKQISKA